jgi:diguanylate cyclase (GGDEF)-like protein
MTSPNLDRVLDAVFRVDADFDVKFISETGRSWLERSGSAPSPQNFLDLLHPDDIQHFKNAIHGVQDVFSCDVRVLRGEGECWVNIRGYQLLPVHQYVICIIDISAWKSDISVFRYAAEHDELTDLANRAFLKRTVDDLIQRNDRTFVLALLDLDGFKKINDTFGHNMGDVVLLETANRLMKVAQPNDLVVRLGGDEFVLLMLDKNSEDAQAAMANVLFALARPYDTAPHNTYLSASIGLAEYPMHGTDYSALLGNADIAMYRAKNDGKNRVSVFTPIGESSHLSIETAMHNGIEEGEFYIAYQPQYDMNRNIVGAEALMRWTNHHLGPVAPDQFIPIAEETGLMPMLGKWALRYACHQLKQFQELLPEFVISVNVSPVQFRDEHFETTVIDAISEMHVDPARVVLEITESTLMYSQEKTERSLMALREKGVRFSIDDFGTGFSSLAYLTRFPVSSIKIDKSFTWTIRHQSSSSMTDQKLVTAMIHLAHSIGLKVVAEGVENEAQFDFLKNSGCDLVQGYLMGRPMSAEALIDLLHQNKKRELPHE